MEERLKRLLALHAQATEDLKKLEAQRQAITDIVREEGREDLTVEEDADFRTKTAEIKAKQGEIDAYDERIKELSEEIERAGKLNESATAIKRAQSRIQSVKEAVAYEKSNGASYFRDMMRVARQMDADGEAAERLRRHAIDVKTGQEYRDLNRTDGTGGYAVPPLWLMAQFIELARSSRAYANVVTNQPLPSGTDSINIPKILTGTATAIQTADNAAVQETDLADTSVQANVKTIAGQQDVAIQLLDQSPINFDEVIFRDLVADYATKVDLQVISGSNGSGQVQGVRGTSGITTVTATSGSDNVGLLFAKIADAVQQIHTTRYMPPTAIVMHPRRWAFFLAARDTSGRPLVVPSGPGQNQIANFGSVAAEQVVGSMHGLPVITDPNLPTNLGASTNQDVIHVLRAEDLWLYESSIRTRVLPEVGSGTLTTRLQVYGYLAFTAGRFPASVAEIGGTALTPPTFT
jgi:HK97 family phage major capsid protein